MDESAPARVVFHGAVVLLIGLLCGIPFAQVLTAGGDPELARAWRVAHVGIAAGGILGIATGPALRHVALGARGATWLVGALITSLYGFAVALILGPLAGVRGLEAQGPPANLLVFAANTVASVASVVAAVLLAMGAWRRVHARGAA
jgi:hypothetical protein